MLQIRHAYQLTSSRLRHVSNVDDELISIGREYGDRQPHRLSLLIERDPGYLEDGDPAIGGEIDEARFSRVGRPDRDQVAIPDLGEAEGLDQVLHGAFLDVVCVSELDGSVV